MLNNKELKHVAIILDGNGRWAKEQNKKRTFGHKIGMQKIYDTAVDAIKNNIKYLTLFCFSTENWNRPKPEVDYLMKVPEEIFKDKNLKKFEEQKIQINWIGRKSKIPITTRNKIQEVVEKQIEDHKLILTIAFDYGSFEEIVTATQEISKQVLKNEIKIEDISKELILKNLYTKNLPQVDLLIRTGGELRLSNFLLLQLEYAELYFTKIYWPDFSKKDFEEAINEFNNRNRRYGKIKDE